MIEFKNVTKKYDNKTVALNNVSLNINKGEFVFVVGSSGAGKSTFLKLMMREEVPTSGTITIDGIVLNKMRKKNIPILRRKLGVVFQDFRLIPTMTVFDNVAFAMRVIGTKEKKIRRRVPYLLSLMGLSDKSRNYPRELSGGEQQRVALARALANDAEVIIADEPTGNVDPKMSYEIVDLLMRLNEAGTTVIMVTHEHSLVKCFDKRVIILDKGSVVSDGELQSLDAASGHINAASEIASEYSKSAEDYSVYSKLTVAVEPANEVDLNMSREFAGIEITEDISSGAVIEKLETVEELDGDAALEEDYVLEVETDEPGDDSKNKSSNAVGKDVSSGGETDD